MPVSVVVGGQFGSEGKGKVALEIARRDSSVVAAIRVGGTNSGHTAFTLGGEERRLRQLPAAALDGEIAVILPAGSYIDLEVLEREIPRLGLRRNQIFISPMARIITKEHKEWEAKADLVANIGSTGSGTGAAVMAMTARQSLMFPLPSPQANAEPKLQDYLADTGAVIRRILNDGKRVIIEGTQGFGLSVLQGGLWPYATSRDTTAAGFLAEAGLSPLDVDDVTMVIRSNPIRSGGNTGPLANSTTWNEIAKKAGLSIEEIEERATVTGRLRRPAWWDPTIVRLALQANQPTRLVLNHLDQMDGRVRSHGLTSKALAFIQEIEQQLERQVDWLGTGRRSLLDRSSARLAA